VGEGAVTGAAGGGAGGGVSCICAAGSSIPAAQDVIKKANKTAAIQSITFLDDKQRISCCPFAIRGSSMWSRLTQH